MGTSQQVLHPTKLHLSRQIHNYTNRVSARSSNHTRPDQNHQKQHKDDSTERGNGPPTDLLHEIDVHDDEEAEEGAGCGKAGVLEHQPYPGAEELGERAGDAGVHAEEGVLGIHPDDPILLQKP